MVNFPPVYYSQYLNLETARRTTKLEQRRSHHLKRCQPYVTSQLKMISTRKREKHRSTGKDIVRPNMALHMSLLENAAYRHIPEPYLEEVKFTANQSKQLLAQWILYPSNSKCYHPPPFLLALLYFIFSTTHQLIFFWFQILPLLLNSVYNNQTDHSQIPSSYKLLDTNDNQVGIDTEGQTIELQSHGRDLSLGNRELLKKK